MDPKVLKFQVPYEFLVQAISDARDPTSLTDLPGPVTLSVDNADFVAGLHADGGSGNVVCNNQKGGSANLTATSGTLSVTIPLTSPDSTPPPPPPPKVAVALQIVDAPAPAAAATA